MNKITRKGKLMLLAYDQGLEHGPSDFNDSNVNPKKIINIAKHGEFTGVVFQKGIAEKYVDEIKKSGVPLVVKLNGKTGLHKGEPISRQLCTVEEAIAVGAVAVGYTIYIGSDHEDLMLTEFVDIQRVAHKKGLPVIAWIYPRGAGVKGKKDGELLAYATRVGLEVGADIVKVHWEGTEHDLEWAVESAGKVKVVIAGGKRTDDEQLTFEIRTAMKAGVSGVAIGRNVWQHKNPMEISKKIKKEIFG